MVLNKTDLLPPAKRQSAVEKMTKRLQKTLENTRYALRLNTRYALRLNTRYALRLNTRYTGSGPGGPPGAQTL